MLLLVCYTVISHTQAQWALTFSMPDLHAQRALTLSPKPCSDTIIDRARMQTHKHNTELELHNLLPFIDQTGIYTGWRNFWILIRAVASSRSLPLCQKFLETALKSLLNVGSR